MKKNKKWNENSIIFECVILVLKKNLYYIPMDEILTCLILFENHNKIYNLVNIYWFIHLLTILIIKIFKIHK